MSRLLELLPTAISLVSVAISFIALWLSVQSKIHDNRRDARVRTNELSSKLIDADEKIMDVWSRPQQFGDFTRRQIFSDQQSQRIGTICRLMIELVQKEKGGISSTESFLLANALSATSHPSADDYWKKSIADEPVPYFQGYYSSVYAGYLYMMGRVDDGVEQFKKALKAFGSGATDFHRSIVVQTLMNWGRAEIGAGRWELANIHFTEAQEACGQISTWSIRNELLQQIETQRQYSRKEYEAHSPQLSSTAIATSPADAPKDQRSEMHPAWGTREGDKSA